MKKILSLLLIPVLLASCGTFRATETSFIMDTVVTWDISHVSAGELIDMGIATAEDCEGMLSRFIDDSAVSLLNRDGELRHTELTQLLRIAEDVSAATDGAYDVTVAPLVSLWNVAHGGDGWVPPTEAEIASLLPLVDYTKLGFIEGLPNLPEYTVTLPLEMDIDLGGIGKGWALGKSAQVIARLGGVGTVSFGGNIALIGRKSESADWRVGLKDPAAPDTLAGILTLPSGIVAVSGGYERYAEYGGVRYHHILDPRTGYPARTDIASAAVWVASADAPSGALADALSTALFVSGSEAAAVLHASGQFDFEYVLILDDGSAVVSDGLTGKYTEK